MWGYRSELVLFLERTRERIPLLWYILGCCVDGISSWIRPLRRFYLRWRLWVNVLCIFLLGYPRWYLVIEKGPIYLTRYLAIEKEPIYLIRSLAIEKGPIYLTRYLAIEKEPIYLIRSLAIEKGPIDEIWSSLNIKPYKFRNIRIPQHILLDIGNDSQPKCERIFETIKPNIIRSNITDKDLVRLLFGNRINSTYLKYNTKLNETTFIMQGKLCSDSSREWLFFTTFEEESVKQSIDENLYTIETSSSNRSRETYKCVSFDFEKCSLVNLQNDYPRLFQFDRKQPIKTVSNDKRGGTDTEIIQIVYYYIRRKASDYIKYEAKFKEIDTPSLNLTIIPDLITSRDIYIKVKITQNKTSITNMNCVTTLQEKDSDLISSLEMINPVIKFDQLSASTSYDVCVSCKGIDKVCKQIKTSERSSFEPQYDEQISFMVLLIILIIIITLAYFLTMKIRVALCHRQSTRSNVLPEDNQSINFDTNTNTNEDERSNTDSLLTRSCRSVREARGSISSIDSTYSNR